LKSISASLLKKITEKYDGTTKFIVNYCLQLITFALEGRNMSNINNYNLLAEGENQWILTKITEDLQIETSVLIFCTLQEVFENNEALFDNMKFVMETSITRLLIVDSKIIHSRMIMFLGLFADILFENDNECFSNCIRFLFMHLFSYSTNQGLSHQVSIYIIKL
jgi:hypothetical protein